MTVRADIRDTAPTPTSESAPRRAHPIRNLVFHRGILGVVTVALVSVLVYTATLILPGDAATAILGQQATPQRLALLRKQLHLNENHFKGMLSWFGHALQGDFGTSLVQQRPVWQVVEPRLLNSIALVVLAAVVSTVAGIALGAFAAARRDGVADHAMSVLALVASALPEFVVGVLVVLVFAVKVVRWFPAVSVIPAGSSIWAHTNELVLPVVTLVIVITPYVFRMVRASMIEALTSDYAETAELKGVSPTRLIFGHALPNALAPSIQVVGLNLLYLAGGIVLVETVFQYPGIGLALVDAINGRDVPVIQCIVVLLSIFYVVLNIVTDVAVLLVTPRRRLPR